MRRISKRLEALERAADKEVFANAYPYALAYYLGGAKHESELTYAFARALGYKDLDQLCEGVLHLLQRSTDGPLQLRARTSRALGELLAKFGYDLRRMSPAATADALYRIVKTLPEEWRAIIKSAHRENCEAEARSNQILKHLMERLQGDQRQYKGGTQHRGSPEKKHASNRTSISDG
jgi:hypothetical protein